MPCQSINHHHIPSYHRTCKATSAFSKATSTFCKATPAFSKVTSTFSKATSASQPTTVSRKAPQPSSKPTPLSAKATAVICFNDRCQLRQSSPSPVFRIRIHLIRIQGFDDKKKN
jgi:hypothetical protein